MQGDVGIVDAQPLLTSSVLHRLQGSWYSGQLSQRTMACPLDKTLEQLQQTYSQLFPVAELPLGHSIQLSSAEQVLLFAKWNVNPASFTNDTDSHEWVLGRLKYMGKRIKLGHSLEITLPQSIDMTTVEIITYFPAYIHDPFFQC